MAKDEILLGNSQALNAIINRVDRNTFKVINAYVSTNEAWEILDVVHEQT